MTSLPVSEVLPELGETLEQQNNVVLVAPPGAGKTTYVPLFLLKISPSWLENGKIILVEPRRVAVRAAAMRMASLLGEKPGETVGYTTRLERVVSESTRIEVVTEGLLVRRLLKDPLIEGSKIVIFDEVHERSLDGDTALGLCLDVQRSFRSDLRLLAMSATLDTTCFIECLQAPLLESKGKQYPVDVRYMRDIAHIRDLPERCVEVLRSLWEREEGSFLVFLPGVGEIRRVEKVLRETLPIFPLFGEQSIEEQNKALDPHSGRRIVLATSIAETSVTVPGVRVVVDGGWRRVPVKDSSTGLSRLQTRRVSRATSDQRAGRAGREAPGIVVRLWSEMTQRALSVQEMPAIREADLCDFALISASWFETMGTEVQDIPFVECPPEGGLAASYELLRLLGAIDSETRLTALGRRMVGLGTHPRLAAIMCAAETESECVTAACLVALLEERDPFIKGARDMQRVVPIDIRKRLRLFVQDGIPSSRYNMRVLKHSAKRFLRRMGKSAFSLENIQYECVGKLIASGFPDRIAQLTNKDGRYRLAGGGSARVSLGDELAEEKFLACAAFHVRKSTEITLAAPISPEVLRAVLWRQLVEQREGSFDGVSGRVIVRERVRLGNIILHDKNVAAEAEDIVPALLQKISSDMTRYLEWDANARQFQARVMLAREYGALYLPDISDDVLSQCTDWLEPWLVGVDRLSQVKELNVVSMLKALFSYESLQELDHKVPVWVELRKGKAAIDYTTTIPSVSARAQAFYGLNTLPIILDGRVPLHAILLSPAGRPQAVTADLERFWKGGWLDMRRDMRGRYPKHDWPENP